MVTRRDLLASGGAAAAGVLLTGASGDADEPGTLAEPLGYAKDDRLLILHADDVGMCHSANAATIRALTDGVATCGSVMVPCPWFPGIAAWGGEHPEADLGIHLTLTSEWRHYRWRPVAPAEQVKGLLDPDGFFWRTVAEVKAHASPAEVEAEVRAQIERARKFGMKPTHVDSHMGALFADPRYFEVYTRVSRETGLPPMLPGPSFEIVLQAKAMGIDYPALVEHLKAQGYVFLDRLVQSLAGKMYEDRVAAFQALVRSLKPGVTQLILHLAGDDEEIRHVTNAWQDRYHDFRLLTDPATRAFLRDQGVKLIGYRPLTALWKP